ncbi:hypothetical protein C5E07_16640 [Pseudoclavibacter sp. RFBJ3]|uniref:hypothetical protein n=1 Tax=unclassified Pseudoclavibacter TaxID=2615177 RepID=UPI000CE8E232|nr:MULTISPECIES: hypothetical protein [unclassified Pseudoclavibacter]PPF87564.1 hypothetical protein C5C12_00450 [Pseudoclavibacter sp. RFBJ5]PPF90414.1 hypothetical protein C5E07_16640 [Pseudoclavibacter sp. RFBJ3]PPG01099.1 hypothetical protein C5C19_00450 [Pseudoclavibacter sp. RFBH5]PPG26202.1 hypothetical protein C5E13_00405 [Pseudoclavibacter sp. RFBI4]
MAKQIDLYHRTTEDAAAQIVRDGKFLTRENTREAFASTHVEGQAEGYGAAVVHVRIDQAAAELDDEFPDGEQHYRIPLDQAQVIDAFKVGPDGERSPIAPAASKAWEASFPKPPRTGSGPVAEAQRATSTGQARQLGAER